jgi:hypothetical protein
VLGINVFSNGKLHVDRAGGSLPNGGMAELRRLLEERGALRHRAGGEAGEGSGGADHHRIGGLREWDADQRALEGRIVRLTEARERAERERDEARAKLRKAERRLSGKPAEGESLEDQLWERLWERPAGANARSAGGGANDRKFEAAKSALAKICQRNWKAASGTPRRALLLRVFKEIWAEMDRIDGI